MTFDFLGGLAGIAVAVALALMLIRVIEWLVPCRLPETPLSLRAERWDVRCYGTERVTEGQ